MRRTGIVIALGVVLTACQVLSGLASLRDGDLGPDGGAAADAQADGTVALDGGNPDGTGGDASTDAGTSDAPQDSGVDAGLSDANSDGATDAGVDASLPCNTNRDCTTNGGQCVNQTCTTPKSCTGVSKTCGSQDTEDCCASPLIPAINGVDLSNGGSANISGTLSAYRLDKFEVTVERFRQFVGAYQSPGTMVAEGAGAHPKKPGKYELQFQQGSGWDPAWAGSMPADAAALATAVGTCQGATYTSAATADDHRAMHCVSWYEAFLFCAWDGGRLPTLAELFNAAIGGSAQLSYPWGGAPPSDARLQFDKLYGTKPEAVGKKPQGNGTWGHADLYGNVEELSFDWLWTGVSGSCLDCFVMGAGNRSLVGANISLPAANATPWRMVASGGSTLVQPSSGTFAQDRATYAGIRCARYVQ